MLSEKERSKAHLEHDVAQGQGRVAGEYAGEGTATAVLLFDHIIERVAAQQEGRSMRMGTEWGRGLPGRGT